MGSVEALSKYRYERAVEDLEAARKMYRDGMYRQSLNRSYYSIFHALRSLTALDDFDSSKHSGVIAYFNQNYVKTGIFDKGTSKIIKSASIMREQSDYMDFYTASRQETERQMKDAGEFIAKVEMYLKEKNVL